MKLRPKFQDIEVGTIPSGIKVKIKDCHSAMREFLNRLRNRPVEPVICISGLHDASALGAWAHVEVQDVDDLCGLLKEAKKIAEERMKK